ncbi:putative superfamily III holin-X [Brevibacterium sanguinis]|uniref:Superfamily III holin-X n=2 Tax=Brevibacterium TaxID=1696 RepID=A0ABX9GKK7_9MICO|nr:MULTISPECIES: phage holin family protein [Brevibacterium]RBP61987.1 putative superfamily III holin-X [Brevibacterium sanguinis]RBP70591.1 putative superfamily III holin-X [Brevibacterium celere]
MSHPEPRPEPTTAELITRLSEQTSRLVRDEMKLARAELTAKAKQGGIGAGYLGAGGVLALFGFGSLIATAIIALALILPAWAAALIVTVVLFIAAGIAAMMGKKKVENLSPTPERTMTNLQRDVAEVKESSRHDTP